MGKRKTPLKGKKPKYDMSNVVMFPLKTWPVHQCQTVEKKVPVKP